MNMQLDNQSEAAEAKELLGFLGMIRDLFSRIRTLSAEDRLDIMDLMIDWATNDDPEQGIKNLGLIMAISHGEANDDVTPTVMPLEHEKSTNGDVPKIIEDRKGWVAHQIKELRDKKGWTQQELADVTDLPQSHISRLENKEHSPSTRTIEKLAKAFGVSPKVIDHPRKRPVLERKVNMSRKNVNYNKKGIDKLPDDKPALYKIKTEAGTTNYAGVAKRGRVSERVAEHLKKIPGSTVSITPFQSIADAKKAEVRTIKREQPKYNKKGK